MKELKQLHEQAMELSEQAFLSKREGNVALAKELSKKAFALESKAAQILKDKPEIEPTRSILYRSAATLAIECGENTQAIDLIKEALNGNPPIEIAIELEILSKVSANNLKKSFGYRNRFLFSHSETTLDKDKYPKKSPDDKNEQQTKKYRGIKRRTDLSKDTDDEIFTLIRGAIQAKHPYVDIPDSAQNWAFVSIWKEQGYISNYRRMVKGINKGAKFIIRVFLLSDTNSGYPPLTSTRKTNSLKREN